MFADGSCVGSRAVGTHQQAVVAATAPMALALLLGLLLVLATGSSAFAPPFGGPAFADGPYNSLLGALGSSDKAIISQEGIITRLYTSTGAAGMGRRPIGEGIRLVRRGGASRLTAHAAFDEAEPHAPVHLFSSTYSDGCTLEVRVLQLDSGTGGDMGYVFNVSATNGDERGGCGSRRVPAGRPVPGTRSQPRFAQ